MWVDHDSFISNGRVIYSFESLITLKQPSRNMRGRQNDSLEIGPESRYIGEYTTILILTDIWLHISCILVFDRSKVHKQAFSPEQTWAKVTKTPPVGDLIASMSIDNLLIIQKFPHRKFHQQFQEKLVIKANPDD